MQPARPLRDVFEEVARGDLDAGAAEALADSGHGDLPDQLVSEAIVSYADTAPVEVAEHLAPFVMVHSAVPAGDAGAADLAAGQGLDLLATAPEPIIADDEDGGDLPQPAAGDLSYADALDFGFGAGADHDRADLASSIEDPEPDEAVAVEPNPADDIPLAAAAEPAYPWIAPPEVEVGDEPEHIDPSG